ncbi:hypothetical protein HAALTHF_54440n [Vreelandella aquamarina]|nr:hypothetical protein HAALTHF_54440n [Halomonas axialensis]
MTTGHTDLCRQIALRYMLSGIQLPMDELVITNGAMEALNLALQCVTQPGDLVAIESPAFMPAYKCWSGSNYVRWKFRFTLGKGLT